MNQKKNKIKLLIVVVFSAIGPLLGQPVYDLSFQGMLTDIEGNRIANENFDLTVQLKRVSGSETLFEFSSATTTDQEGWFGFTISEISRFLKDGETFSDPVVIKMEFLPNSTSQWIDQGGDFIVNYTLSSRHSNQTIEMEMTRMEGSKLMVHSEDHLYAFKDQYPFAYLTGGFLITDQPPVNSQLLNDLKQWLLPEEVDEEGAASRGVKGGFPTGGYYRKK
jgi:hypothetical protein